MRSTPPDYNASYRFSSSSQSSETKVFKDETIIDLWGVGPNRPPIDTHHPAVITHPVTGLKALNVTNGFVTGFAELKKKESGKRFPMFHLILANSLYTTCFSFLSTISTAPQTIKCVGNGSGAVQLYGTTVQLLIEQFQVIIRKQGGVYALRYLVRSPCLIQAVRAGMKEPRG
jgi:hypothetical protein